MATDDTHFRLRLPADLHDRLTEAAKVSERSINAEIVYRLRQTLNRTVSEADLLEEKVWFLQREAQAVEEQLRRARDDKNMINASLREAFQKLELARKNERS